ncbi:MAG: hypothetical protein J3K34DRAFT_93236 [Monoraphidium minutum]|nr:MAG: hypothetical protein J3K34DRAFT_93236 [Monoraphidium minutum]
MPRCGRRSERRRVSCGGRQATRPGRRLRWSAASLPPTWRPRAAAAAARRAAAAARRAAAATARRAAASGRRRRRRRQRAPRRVRVDQTASVRAVARRPSPSEERCDASTATLKAAPSAAPGGAVRCLLCLLAATCARGAQGDTTAADLSRGRTKAGTATGSGLVSDRQA